MRVFLPPAFLLMLAFAEPFPAIADAVPRGGRVLGVDVNEGADGDYLAAFELGQSVGMQASTLHQGWDDRSRP